MAIVRYCALLALALAGTAQAQSPATGPIIEQWGPAFDVPGTPYNLDAAEEHRVVFDIGDAPEDPAALNRGIESAARFLNMHARAGIDPGRLHLAVVLHGAAAAAALNDAAYRARSGVDNPDRGLVEALAGAGVRFFLCGQTAGHRGYDPADLLPQVALAVSAMTAHVRLQEEGYRAILF